MSNNKYKNIKKVGLAIICFEGTEHLYNIISAIRESVDYVSIGLQRTSYHGDPISNIDLNEIFRLRDEDHLVDNIVEIELDMKKEPRVQETDKRNILIQDAENHGCSHCLVIDSDEYYTKKAFDYGLQQIDEYDYEMTYCQYVNYYHDYCHYLKYPFSEGMYVPWVSKTRWRHSYDCGDFPKPSDPTRRFVRTEEVIGPDGKKTKKVLAEFHIFQWNEVKMHHLSWLRADIRKKLENWSSKKVFKNYNDLIDKAVVAFNNFSEDDKNPQALMLFNTPGNKVDIATFPRQFIHPAVDYTTRLRPAKDYKKLLFLSMSCDAEPFNTLESVCNKTWRNYDSKKYQNVHAEFWTYTDAKPGVKTYADVKNHIIYVGRPSGQKQLDINATFSKTVETLFYITDTLKLEFDYIIRTNNSTWLNVPLINEILAYTTDDSLWYAGKLYAAYFSAFNIYCGGQLMIWSRRNVDVIKGLCESTEKARLYEQKYFACDDNAIGGKINQRNILLKLKYADVYHSIGSIDIIGKTFDDSDIDFACPSIQVKTFPAKTDERIKYDVEKMQKIDAMWRSANIDLDELYRQTMKCYFDKIVVVLPYSKKQWFAEPEEERPMMRYRKKNEYARAEAFEFLKTFQKQCGYLSGMY